MSTGPTSDLEDPIYKKADYKPVLSNWFAAKPYGFRFTPKSGDPKVMYLPIGPSNLQIATQFATNIIPTIAGTVEEHSPVRYYDIAIEGTTGMVPKFVEPMSPSARPNAGDGTMTLGRSSFSVQQNLSIAAFGFLSQTLGAADAANGALSAIRDITGNASNSAITGVFLDQTGYLAFHNLYRFFLQYKKDVAGVNDKTPRKANAPPPLVFFNHKDNNEYSVVIKSFVLRRDKENPMLYFYSIALRGYDLRDLNYQRGFVRDLDEDLYVQLGLNGIKDSNILSKIKEGASAARDALGSVAGGINQLGR